MPEKKAFEWDKVPWNDQKKAIKMIAENVSLEELERHVNSALVMYNQLVETSNAAAAETVRRFSSGMDARRSEAINFALTDQVQPEIFKRGLLLETAIEERKELIAERALEKGRELPLLAVHNELIELEKKVVSGEELSAEEKIQQKLLARTFYDRLDSREPLVPSGETADMVKALMLMEKHIAELEGELGAEDAVKRMIRIRGTVRRELGGRGVSAGRDWMSWDVGAKESEAERRARLKREFKRRRG